MHIVRKRAEQGEKSCRGATLTGSFTSGEIVPTAKPQALGLRRKGIDFNTRWGIINVQYIRKRDFDYKIFTPLRR